MDGWGNQVLLPVREAICLSGRMLGSEGKGKVTERYCWPSTGLKLCVRWFTYIIQFTPQKTGPADIDIIISHPSKWCSYHLNLEQYPFFPAARPFSLCMRLGLPPDSQASTFCICGRSCGALLIPTLALSVSANSSSLKRACICLRASPGS